jgi:hypothetical protein
VAVVYRPKFKGFRGRPVVLKSPTGQESFDAIEVTDQVRLEYWNTPAGFGAVVTIPLAVLGWAPRPGSTVRLDLGYLFGNETGNQCALRAYWSNTGPTAGIIGDVPSENWLAPAWWGTATVERARPVCPLTDHGPPAKIVYQSPRLRRVLRRGPMTPPERS